MACSLASLIADVEKGLQLRSHIAQGLNVQKRVRLDLSLAAALLDDLFEHPQGNSRESIHEQEPGPRGSPHDPHAPELLELAQSAFAPTPNEENCFCSFVALHDGQAGVVEPCTSASNRWLHSWQRYSKMGMMFSCSRNPL
jgi:hypothetical protein